MTKIVTVVGATGAQGKGVVAGFINNPAYKVRAITRNPFGAAGKALAAQGAEVIPADLSDVAGLKAAFAGSHVIFGVTNFYEPFIALQSPAKAMEVEVQQGINLAEAAAATLTLEHFIWSTLSNAKAISGGRYLLPHFEGKNRVDAHIRERLPALLAKTTFLWVGFYHSNLASPVFQPYWIPSAGKYIQFANYHPETPITTIGDVTVNLAPFARAIVEQPDKTVNGGIVLGAVKTYRADDFLQAWAAAKGVKAQIVGVSHQVIRDLWPLQGDLIGLTMEYSDDARERSWTEPSGRRIITKEDLGIADQLQSLEEAYKTFELPQ